MLDFTKLGKEESSHPPTPPAKPAISALAENEARNDPSTESAPLSPFIPIQTQVIDEGNTRDQSSALNSSTASSDSTNEPSTAVVSNAPPRPDAQGPTFTAVPDEPTLTRAQKQQQKQQAIRDKANALVARQRAEQTGCGNHVSTDSSSHSKAPDSTRPTSPSNMVPGSAVSENIPSGTDSMRGPSMNTIYADREELPRTGLFAGDFTPSEPLMSSPLVWASFRPRAAMRRVMTRPMLSAFLEVITLAALAGISFAVVISFVHGSGFDQSLWSIAFTSIMNGSAAGLAILFCIALFLRPASWMLGGQGDIINVMRALSWSQIPVITLGIALFALMPIFGLDLFRHDILPILEPLTTGDFRWPTQDRIIQTQLVLFALIPCLVFWSAMLTLIMASETLHMKWPPLLASLTFTTILLAATATLTIIGLDYAGIEPTGKLAEMTWLNFAWPI